MRDERKRTESDDLAEIEAANERENIRLFGQPDVPVPVAGGPMTLAELIRSDFANIWINAERKNR